MKLPLSALAFVLALTGTASAVTPSASQVIAPGAVLNRQDCHITDGSLLTNIGVLGGSATCGTNMKIMRNGMETNDTYISARLLPMHPNNWSSTPINIFQRCYYLKNTTAKTIFVPAKNQAELDSFLSKVMQGGMPGVAAARCPGQSITISDAEMCHGKMFTGASQPYSDGFTSIAAQLGLRTHFYYIKNQNSNEVLRTVMIRPIFHRDGSTSWSAPQFTGTCPPENASPQQLNDLDTAAGTPTFDRNNSGTVPHVQPAAQPVAAVQPVATAARPAASQPASVSQAASTVQRIPTTDGALVRNIQATPTDRVLITDGALIRNIQ